MSKATNNIIEAMAILNSSIPGIAKVIVSFKGGREIDLQSLCKNTKDIVEQKLKEAQEHLAKE